MTMIKRLLASTLVIILVSIAQFANAQVSEQCKFDALHKKRMAEDPGFAEGVNEARKQIQKILKEQEQQLLQPTTGAQYQLIGDVIEIPVVVHIIHTGTSVGVGANISNSQVDSAIAALNDRFRKTPGTHGDASGVDSRIQFVLASRDPDCNATTGIVRVNGSSVSNYATQGISAGGSSGANEIDVKNLSRWPNTDYMNIWVVSEIENNNAGFGIQGYAYFPGASAVVDGLVVQHSSFGVTGTVNTWNNLNRTVTHEVGHYLGLYHTFEGDSGGTTCPPVTNGCGTGLGDCVTDTEPHSRSSSNCPTGSNNTCTGNTVGLVIRNYMDYSSQTCADMYTNGQKSVMRAALFGPRRGLISSSAYLPPDTLTLANAACSPQTTNLSNGFGIGVRNFTLDSLNVSSPGSVSDSGYVDRTCSQVQYLEPNTSYDISVATGTANNEDVRVFIDYNGDGDFLDTLESVFSSDTDTLHTGTITTPANVVFNEKLRVRVLSEWHALTTNLNAGGSCYTPTYGQAEDFAIVFADTTTTPFTGCISQTNGTWNVNPTSLWSCSSIPDSTTDVIISSGDSVIISSDAKVGKLRIESGGILQLAPGVELVVTGDSIHIEGSNGKLNCGSGSTLILRGNSGSIQRVKNDASNPLRFENLVLQNNEDIEFISGGDFELAGGIAVKNEDIINNASSFTFISDQNSTGHISEWNSASGVSGNDFTIQRFVSSRLAEWNTTGASGVVTTIEDLDGEISTSGFTGTDTPSGSPSIQYWSNTQNTYVTPNNTSDTFRIGVGYHVWLENSSGQWTDDHWELEGPLQITEVNLDVNSSGTGWNLLANPFAAYLDFQTLNAANSGIVGDEFWYYDADSVTFNSRGPNTFIPPGQGFWVNWSGGASSIDVDLNDIRSDLNTSEFFKNGPIDQLKLVMHDKESTTGDAIFIRKEYGSSSTRDDHDLDVIQRPAERKLMLSMPVEDGHLMVNHIDPYQSHRIPISASVSSPGEYILKWNGTKHFGSDYCVELVIGNERINLVEQKQFKLEFQPDQLSQELTLVLGRVENCEEETLASPARVFANQGVLRIDLLDNEKSFSGIEVYDMLGARIFKSSFNSVGRSTRIDLSDYAGGIYLIRLEGHGWEQVEKIVLD